MHLTSPILPLLSLGAAVGALLHPQQSPLRFDQDRTPKSSPLSDGFNKLVNETLERYHVPGLAISVVHGAETFAEGYGYAQFSPDIPVTANTLFFGASTGKAFTAAALSFLVDDDENFPEVQWTTPISELIRDDFVLMDEYATTHVTLQDALTHRTGLPRHDMIIRSGDQPVRDVVRSLRYLPLTRPLRTEFQYSNLMYVTLGYVVEALTGRWLGDVLRERIFEPLGMNDTFFDLGDAVASGKPLAKGHMWLYDEQKFLQNEYLDDRSTAGAGAVISNVLDYAKWIRMFLRTHPQFPNGGPISEASHRNLLLPQMIQEQLGQGGRFALYAYGWTLFNYRGTEIVTHEGAVTGFGSIVLFIPALDWGVTMMANSYLTSSLAMDVLLWHLVDDVLDTPQAERINHTAAVDDLLAEIKDARNTTKMIDKLYPPEKIAFDIPPLLPLQEYAGTYTHPAYGPWTITFHNETLRVPMDRGPVLHFTDDSRIEHISGEHFLLIAYETSEPEDPMYIPAEFLVGMQGVAQSLGLELEDEMAPEKIWLERQLS